MPRDVLAALRLEDGRRWVDAAEPWQLADALAVLEDPCPYHWLGRPRGGSKTSDAAGIALAWLLAGREGGRYYAAAADADQARLLIDAVARFARRTPAIAAAVRVEARRVLAPDRGSVLEVVAADAASSWGLRPGALILDELAWWADTGQPRALLDSLLSSAAKSSDCRVMVITSPSSPSHFAYRELEHARSDEMWRVSERTGLVPWLDPARVAEQQRRLSDPMYRRLFLGEWAEGDESLALTGDVDGCVTHSGPLDPQSGVRYVIGADLGVKRDRTAVAVEHRDGDRIVLDRIAVWKGSRLRPVQLGEVEEFIRQASRSYNNATLIADPWQSIQLLERLRGQGVKASEFTFSQAGVGRLAAVMVELLRDRRLALPDDPELLAELRAVRLVERAPGAFRIDHAAGAHDDQVIAIALAAQHLLREREDAAPQMGPHIWSAGGRDGLAAWRPQHDGSDSHRDWAARHGCQQCEGEHAAYWARVAADQQDRGRARGQENRSASSVAAPTIQEELQ